ncbi:STY4851/ECs_5259 family protein [Mesorhizobium sp. Root102]|uniref:STY4851/ECs_5259 family protein n=1 Tax=Mesorhizobium sp. Root102 TaxID=1736422 RepID=UPI000AB853ED|nr:STY4851/ECs_5259 family protein [Mesorhizobium sp. Root102]
MTVTRATEIADALGRYALALQNWGAPDDHPFNGVYASSVDVVERDGLQTRQRNLVTRIGALLTNYEKVGSFLKIATAPTLAAIARLDPILRLAASGADLDHDLLIRIVNSGKHREIAAAAAAGIAWRVLYNQSQAIFQRSAHVAEIVHLRKPLEAGRSSLIRRIGPAYRHASMELASHLNGRLPASALDRIGLVERLAAIQAAKSVLSQQETLLERTLGQHYRGEATDFEQVAAACDWVASLDSTRLLPNPLKLIALSAKREIVAKSISYFKDQSARIERELSILAKAYSLDPLAFFGASEFSAARLDKVAFRFERMAAEMHRLPEWLELQRLKKAIDDLGVDELVSAGELKRKAPDLVEAIDGAFIEDELPTPTEEVLPVPKDTEVASPAKVDDPEDVPPETSEQAVLTSAGESIPAELTAARHEHFDRSESRDLLEDNGLSPSNVEESIGPSGHSANLDVIVAEPTDESATSPRLTTSWADQESDADNEQLAVRPTASEEAALADHASTGALRLLDPLSPEEPDSPTLATSVSELDEGGVDIQSAAYDTGSSFDAPATEISDAADFESPEEDELSHLIESTDNPDELAGEIDEPVGTSLDASEAEASAAPQIAWSTSESSTPFDLSRLSDLGLAQHFVMHRESSEELRKLNEVLKSRNSDAASDLHIEVQQALRQLRHLDNRQQRPAIVATGSGPVRDWIREFLSARGLTYADGRPLYRYRMSDEEYAKAKSTLVKLGRDGRLNRPDDRSGALFVIYCAEWFRRESSSTFLRWNDLAPDIFDTLAQNKKADLTSRGLIHWRRDLRMNGSTHEYLLTLALEGGFPVRLLDESSRGWLKEYLRSILRGALGLLQPETSEIESIAHEEKGQMRKSYRHNEFVALCAELVERILFWRRKAESEAQANLPHAQLLDLKHPEWREDLPLYIPAGETGIASEILSGLMNEPAAGLPTSGIEATRFLVKIDGMWQPAIQIRADGDMPAARIPHASTGLGRLRAVASGALANKVSGEFALFEPPSGTQKRWRVRPLVRLDKIIPDIPFSMPILANLTTNGVNCPIVWPRGEAVNSEILVLRKVPTEAGSAEALSLAGRGSHRSSAHRLYVLYPEGWAVRPADPDTIPDIELLPHLHRCLATISGATYFESGESGAARYRVEPNSDERDAELDLGGKPSGQFESADPDCDLIEGPLAPSIVENGGLRQPRKGEIFWRRPGDKWTEYVRPIKAVGRIDVSWRDPEASIQLEKRQVAMITPLAGISGRMTSAQACEISVRGLDDWTIQFPQDLFEQSVTSANQMKMRFRSRPAYRIRAVLIPPEGHGFSVWLKIAGRDAAIVLSDGTVLAAGQSIDIGMLRGAVAVSPSRTALDVTLKGSRSSGLTVQVDEEYPLGALRNGIDEILAGATEHDAVAEMVFLGQQMPFRIGRYRYPPPAYVDGQIRFSTFGLNDTTRPVARMILSPRHDHALDPAGDNTWTLPERCVGPCLVYLRDGTEVISKPIVIGKSEAMPSSSILLTAMAKSAHAERQTAVLSALADIAGSTSATLDINWLTELIAHLNGLPASAFDVLRLLPRSPVALIRLLLGCRDDVERNLIWSLQNQLPFLWLQFPKDSWKAALTAEYHTYESAISGLADDLRLKLCGERMIALISAVCDLEPALSSIFQSLGFIRAQVAARSVRDLAQDYIRDQRLRDADGPARRTQGSAVIAENLVISKVTLPEELHPRFDLQSFEGLLVPVLIAACANGRMAIDAQCLLIARRMIRESPAYVSGAYPHFLKKYEVI